MSEGEEFSRMSELTEVSDEEYDSDTNRNDDIPEVDRLDGTDEEFLEDGNLEDLNDEINEVPPIEERSKNKPKP